MNFCFLCILSYWFLPLFSGLFCKRTDQFLADLSFFSCLQNCWAWSVPWVVKLALPEDGEAATAPNSARAICSAWPKAFLLSLLVTIFNSMSASIVGMLWVASLKFVYKLNILDIRCCLVLREAFKNVPCILCNGTGLIATGCLGHSQASKALVHKLLPLGRNWARADIVVYVIPSPQTFTKFASEGARLARVIRQCRSIFPDKLHPIYHRLRAGFWLRYCHTKNCLELYTPLLPFWVAMVKKTGWPY